MDARAAASRSMLRRPWPWLLCIYAIAALLALLVRPAWASLLAPLAGPWAGHLYGHADCTLASLNPGASLIALGVLPVVIAVALVGRRRVAAGVPLLLWSLAWSGLAWLSAVNSTS